jgi:HEAT repeat protein/YHS domain-containing protein
MTTCPVCGKPVDPLRAPAVGVREGKVVPFCSKEHAEAESGPTKLVPTKIVRMPSHGVEEILREKAVTPASGVVTAPAPKVDSAPVAAVAPERPKIKRADSSVQIADTGTLDDYVTPDAPNKRIVLAIALLVLVGAGGAALYFLVLKGKDAAPPAAVVTHDAAVALAPPVDAAPAITKEVARGRAEAVLHKLLGDVSERVQQQAAAALARSGDKQALDALAAALAKEPSELTKVTLAYQLARSGDKRGVDALVAALSGSKRDPRLEAAKRLAMLGDKRAVPVLKGFIGYAEFKIDVASNLALFGEADAIKILEDAVTAAGSQPAQASIKARGLVALARAGKPDAAALQALLSSDGDRKAASLALARLHDPAARPALEKQLGLTAFRADAARGLRMLDPQADTTPLLAPLVSALDTSTRDTEQIDIAEAVLLLTGDPGWSELE